MTRPGMTVPALLLTDALFSGCALAAGGVAGGVAGSGLEEDDGEFDPLENTEASEEVYE